MQFSGTIMQMMSNCIVPVHLNLRQVLKFWRPNGNLPPYHELHRWYLLLGFTTLPNLASCFKDNFSMCCLYLNIRYEEIYVQ